MYWNIKIWTGIICSYIRAVLELARLHTEMFASKFMN